MTLRAVASRWGAGGEPGLPGTGEGTVTRIDTGPGLTGGPITKTGILEADWRGGLITGFGPNIQRNTTTNLLELTGLAQSAYTDTTNANNITSGTLALARLPSIPSSQITGLPNPVGTVTNVATGAGLTGGPISQAGTIVANWREGIVTSLGDGLTLDQGVLSSTGGAPGTDGGTVTHVYTGAGLSGGPITHSGTIIADWRAGIVTSLDTNTLILNNGTLASKGGAEGGPTTITTSPTPPANPYPGMPWFNSSDLQSYIYYQDGTSLQWVSMMNQGGGGPDVTGFMLKAGGAFTGAVSLAANASQPMQPVTLQQLESVLPSGGEGAAGLNNQLAINAVFTDTWRNVVTGCSALISVASGPRNVLTLNVNPSAAAGTAWLAASTAGAVMMVTPGATAAASTVTLGGALTVNGRVSTPNTAMVRVGINVGPHVDGSLNNLADLACWTAPGAIYAAAFYWGGNATAGGGTLVGSINCASNSTTFATSSDGRLKTDRAPISAAYSGDVIERLKPIKFRWLRGDENGPSYGFSAQDVYDVFPQAVTPGNGEPSDDDFRPWMMDYTKLVPVLVAELKHLRRRLIELEARH